MTAFDRSPWEKALSLVDEAADAVRFGEGDEWSPFDPVDDLTIDELDRQLTEVNLVKNAARLVELQLRHRLEGLLVDSGETFTLRGNEFPAVRFGPTVHVFRQKPTQPKVADERRFAEWAGDSIHMVARFELRKTGLMNLIEAKGQSVEALVDSELIDWPEPEGAAVLETIDLHSRYAPKWASEVPDRWETK